MQKKPTLSILIITYNRVAFLETTVLRFISQVLEGGLADDIEIIVGNDASSDGTDIYLTELEKQYQFVKAINHPQNLGVSGNVLSVVAAASGEYIWMFGEDDLIVEGAMKHILHIIKTGEPNYILINTQNIISLDNKNVDYRTVGDRRLPIQEDVLIKNFEKDTEQLLPAKGWLYLTGLISTVACKRKLFLDWMPEAKRYLRLDNVYLYQAPIIMGIAKLGMFYIVAKPMVLHRKNENHWTGSIHKILGVNLYNSSETCVLVKEHIPSEYAEYQKRFAAFILATILSAKKSGVNVNKYIIDAIKKNYNCYPYNIRFLIALITPGIVFRTYAKIFDRAVSNTA